MASLIYAAVIGEFEKRIKELQAPIAKAATATIKEAAAIVKKESKAQMQAAGFSPRSSNAMKAAITPKSGDSINAEAKFFLRPAYLNVFEEGSTIAGKPMIWIPLETVPFGTGGKRLTPKQYIERIGPLFSARNAGRPMLVGKGSRETILRATSRLVRFRKGKLGRGQARGTVNVPLYIGVSSITLKKKLNLKEVVRRVSSQLGEIYQKNVKGKVQ